MVSLVSHFSLGSTPRSFILSWSFLVSKTFQDLLEEEGGHGVNVGIRFPSHSAIPYTIPHLDVFKNFLHSFSIHWSHLKLPLKDRSRPHLCFCLDTRVWQCPEIVPKVATQTRPWTRIIQLTLNTFTTTMTSRSFLFNSIALRVISDAK